MTDTLFITGMARSGTTLVDKVLSAHPDMVIHSQPLPLLFVAVKRRFLEERGYDPDPYPLSPYYEAEYKPGDFAQWLETYVLEQETVTEAFQQMEGYSGRLTGTSLPSPTIVSGRSFYDGLKELVARLSAGESVKGLKEIHCEEYLPYLATHRCKCLLVVRDPRDVIASMRSAGGQVFAGEPRPLLFDLRNWRKSVEFLLEMQAGPNFAWMRYEDLVRAPEAQLSRISDCLDIPSLEGYHGQLADQEGKPWLGNSSYSDLSTISTRSIGRYRDNLAPQIIQYIEAICSAEMSWLDYQAPELPVEAHIRAIEEYQDSDSLRAEFMVKYSTRREALHLEVQRLQQIAGHSSANAQHAFVFPGNLNRLRYG